MKKLFINILFLSVFSGLSAQDIYITFQPKLDSIKIDSILVTNQRTNQKVILTGNDSLLLSQTGTDVRLSELNPEKEYIYPNPSNGDAVFGFSTDKSQNIILSVSNISGQVISVWKQKISPGHHSFNLKFPVTGVYVVSVQKEGGLLSYKAICTGVKMQECGIDYAGSEDLMKLKSASTGKGMIYIRGDILLYSVFSGKKNTIVTDSPTASKVYPVEFSRCIDFDNESYPVVQIGSQWWMAANLKTTKYNDGINIPLVTDNTAWANLSTPGYCWYSNDQGTNGKTYGALYNWYTVNTGKLCPVGWHMPSDDEWTTLATFLGGEEVAGGKMKVTGTTYWGSSNYGASNQSGFSGLPGGLRQYTGNFGYIKSWGVWWSSTKAVMEGAWLWNLANLVTNVYRFNGLEQNGISIRCVRDDLAVSTAAPDSITSHSVILGGEITNDGGNAVTERGVCYGTTLMPTLEGNKVAIGNGKGTFKCKVTGLASNTSYYFRAYAINSKGTVYGLQKVLKTMTGIMGDADGNNYYTVTIGSQVWMAANLQTTKYNDGNSIPLVTDEMEWGNLTIPGYCWYNNDQGKYRNTYGALYNWYTVNTGKLCPAGWHVPSDAEWTTLTAFLGGEGPAAGKMKVTGTTYWESPNSAATNESGFSGLPGGYRDGLGTFNGIVKAGFWWSSTEYSSEYVWERHLAGGINHVEHNYYGKSVGYSVRCLRD